MGLATVVASLSWVQAAADQTSWLLMVAVATAVAGAGLNGIVIAYGKVVPFMATSPCSSAPAASPNCCRTRRPRS